MKKLFINLTVIFLILCIIFIVTKNIFVRRLLETQTEKLLGLNITIKNLDVSPFATHLKVEGLTIDNPPGFEEKEMAYIPLVFIICHPIEFFKEKKIRFYFFDLNIERVNIVKNKEGKVNLKEIKVLENSSQETIKQEGKKLSFYIDIFRLSMGDIYYIDHEVSYTPKSIRYNVNIKNAMFSNVDKPEDIVDLVALKILTNTEIGKFINMSVAPIMQDVKDVVALTEKAVKDTVKGLFGIFSPLKILFGGQKPLK